MKALRLAADLTLPLTAVTETFGILAVRGAGKSNLAAVMAEQMSDAGLPFVVIDPVGSWFGLRAGADGSKDGGLPIPIFGGKHGDVPLERHGGELLADLVVSKRLSCVIDLSAFDSEGAKKAFLLDFARRLYQKNEDPLHLFLEEADDYIPQRPMRDELQLLRAWENIVRRGRARGLGLTLITQRSASINKSVLTQIGTLFVLRTTGPQDRAAIEAWVKYHQTDDDVLASLAGLKDGEAWAWSPHFLGKMQRFHAHRRRTFDSGATPKNLRGKDARPAATLADVDLAAIIQQMASTLERAKADDPKELNAEKDQRIKTLEGEPVQTQVVKAEGHKQKTEPTPVLTDADRALLAKVMMRLDEHRQLLDVRSMTAVQRVMVAVSDMLKGFEADLVERTDQEKKTFTELLDGKRFQRILEKLDRVSAPPVQHSPAPKSVTPLLHTRPQTGNSQATQARPIERARPAGVGGDILSKPMPRALLTALAQHPHGRTKGQVLLHAGYKQSGDTSKAFANMVDAGWIDGRGTLRITRDGLAALGPFDPLPTGVALRERILSQAGPMERALLAVTFDAYPNPLRKGQILDQAGYKPSGDTSRAFSKFIRIGWLVGRGELSASAELFS